MGIVRTKGIVINLASSKDNDKILTVLSGELGKIKVFCKGARKSKGAFLSSTEMFAFSEFMLFEGNSDLYRLNSIEPIEVFYNLRNDVERLAYATLIAKIMNDVCQEGEMSLKKLQLLLNTLYVLANTDKDSKFVLSTFQIRLLGILGYIPRLAKCVICEKEILNDEKCYFSIKDDGVKCEACSRVDKGAIEINRSTYTSLIYILSVDSKKIFSYEISESAEKELELVSKIYFQEKLEKEYKLYG